MLFLSFYRIIIMMKLIEFVYYPLGTLVPRVILIDVSEIAGIHQDENNICWLSNKKGEQFHIVGNYRTLSNRWIYTLEKKFDFYYDDIIRPSVLVYHKPEKMGVDNSFFDEEQLKAFCIALRPELQSNFDKMFSE